jgi:hypothetical protein
MEPWRVHRPVVADLNRADVLCFLSSLPLLPTATTVVFGSYLSSLYCYLTLYCRCGLAYPYDGRGFVGPKTKTIVGLLLFNPLCRFPSL